MHAAGPLSAAAVSSRCDGRRRPAGIAAAAPRSAAAVSASAGAGGRGPVRLDFMNACGERLSGVLHDAGSASCSVFCHGFRSGKESRMAVQLCTHLSNHGHSSFRFDFSGNGESEGEFGYGNYGKEAADVQAALQALLATGLSIRALFGHSKGANSVLLHAARHGPDLPYRLLLAAGARADVREGVVERLGEEKLRLIEERGECWVPEGANVVAWRGITIADRGRVYHVSRAGLAERLSTDVLVEAARIPPAVKVVLLHGDEDRVVPPADSQKLAGVIPGAAWELLPGDHSFARKPAMQAFVKRVAELILV